MMLIIVFFRRKCIGLSNFYQFVHERNQSDALNTMVCYFNVFAITHYPINKLHKKNYTP